MNVVVTPANRAKEFDPTWPWIGVAADREERDPKLKLEPSIRLEQAFDRIAERWWALGESLSEDPSVHLGHMPACVTNASDFGLMLAWSEIVSESVEQEEDLVVVCDDPWIQRHLATIEGVTVRAFSPLWTVMLKNYLRGLLARSVVMFRMVKAMLRTRHHRHAAKHRQSSILVYGHPNSNADGQDAYFGDLMRQFGNLQRVLHVDCLDRRALELAYDGRTLSLHAWGTIWKALSLPFARWRPPTRPGNWLLKRAASKEGATGQPATIAWQIFCQEKWLQECRPSVVAWPWENHSWERALALSARASSIELVGYQHSVIGRQMLNYARWSNRKDGWDLPGTIHCNGAATRSRLEQWGFEGERLAIAGALRFPALQKIAYAPDAPVFVALPFDSPTAAQMLDASRAAAEEGFEFIVKAHPMTPYVFEDSQGVKATERPLQEFEAVSAVLYASTTVGLEALLMGLPTIRFVPEGRIAIDILPDGVEAPITDGKSLVASLRAPYRDATSGKWNEVFGAVDMSLWKVRLGEPGGESGS